MSVAVVDSFLSVHVKKQQGKLPASAAATLDFRIKHIYEVAIISQTGQRIAGGLPAEVILQLALPGDVFGDDFVGFQLALLVEDVSSAEPDLQGRMVLPLPFYFDWIDEGLRVRLTQQLGSSARILNNVTGKVQSQEFLS